MTTTRFVPPRVPLVDPRTGMITRDWYLFFQVLINAVVTPNTDTSGSELASLGPSFLASDQLFELTKAVEALGIAP